MRARKLVIVVARTSCRLPSELSLLQAASGCRDQLGLVCRCRGIGGGGEVLSSLLRKMASRPPIYQHTARFRKSLEVGYSLSPCRTILAGRCPCRGRACAASPRSGSGKNANRVPRQKSGASAQQAQRLLPGAMCVGVAVCLPMRGAYVFGNPSVAIQPARAALRQVCRRRSSCVSRG